MRLTREWGAMPHMLRLKLFTSSLCLLLAFSLIGLRKSRAQTGPLLRRITNTSEEALSLNPSISGDGRYLAFASNRDLVGLNGDANLEIFIYDTLAQEYKQLTNTSGIVGSFDAKLSGNGLRVAYLRDHGATVSSTRDLLL